MSIDFKEAPLVDLEHHTTYYVREGKDRRVAHLKSWSFI